MSKVVSLVKDPRCGTRAGAQAHAKYGEYLCPPCRLANRAYHRVHGRIANRARQRTLTELRVRHPEEFAGYLAVHRADVDAEIETSGSASAPRSAPTGSGSAPCAASAGSSAPSTSGSTPTS